MPDMIDELYRLFEIWQDALANLARLEAKSFALFTPRWFEADAQVRQARKAIHEFLWSLRELQ